MKSGTEAERRFRAVCERNGIALSDPQMDLLRAYTGLLLDWNSKINLISRADVADVWRNHILHSVALLSTHSLPSGARCFDLGTGGGLPGIPVAILRPEAKFVLCDSIAKKIDAVERMREALGLANVRTLRARGEELADAEHLRRYDRVFARAVTGLASLARIAWKLLAPHGELICWKGGDLAEEVAAARRLKQIAEIRIEPIRLEEEAYFAEQKKALVHVSFRAQ